MRRGFLGLLVLVLACVAVPARADVFYGSTTGINGVLYDDCLPYTFRWAIDAPDDAGYRDLSASLVEPNGVSSQTVIVYPDTNEAAGTASFTLCTQVDPYGTYTIRATVEWGPDEQSIGEPVPLPDSHFTLRKPASRTSVTASTRRPAYGQRVAFRIRAFDENPSGFLPQEFTWVHLETRRDGRWVRIRGSRAVTHENGSVKVRVRYLKHHHRTMRVRAVTERTAKYTRSVSPVLRLW